MAASMRAPAFMSRPNIKTPRPARKATVARVMQFNAAFLEQLQQSMERQGQEVGEQVGVPGLTLRQMAGEGGQCTGSMVWSAGLRLSNHLVRNRAEQIRGSRILELGAGTGVVGLTCAALGGHVLLTDLPSVVEQVQSNVEANFGLIEEAGGSAQVAVLDWENPDPEIISQQYDWVLAADVTFDEDHLPALVALMAHLVAANPHGIVKFAHRHRSKELDRKMRDTFAAAGLLIRPVDVRTTATAEYTDPSKVEESIIFYRVYAA